MHLTGMSAVGYFLMLYDGNILKLYTSYRDKYTNTREASTPAHAQNTHTHTHTHTHTPAQSSMYEHIYITFTHI